MPPVRTEPEAAPSGSKKKKMKRFISKAKNRKMQPNRNPFDVLQVPPFPYMVGDKVMIKTTDLVARIPRKQVREVFALIPLSLWGFICTMKRDALFAPVLPEGLSPVQVRVISQLDGVQFQLARTVRIDGKRLYRGEAVGYSFEDPWIVDESWLPSMLVEPLVRRVTGWSYTGNNYQPFTRACKAEGIIPYNSFQVATAFEYFRAIAVSPDFTPHGFQMPAPGTQGFIPDAPSEGASSLASQMTLVTPESWVVPEDAEVGPNGELPLPRPKPRPSKEERKELKKQRLAKRKAIQDGRRSAGGSSRQNGHDEEDVDGVPLDGEPMDCYGSEEDGNDSEDGELGEEDMSFSDH